MEVIETKNRRGRPKKEKRDAIIRSFRIPRDVYDDFVVLADMHERDVTREVVIAMKEYLARAK